MKKILVVDDEKPVREMLKKFLLRKGYEVYEAGTGEEALKIVREEAPAVVLLDIRMPDEDGTEVLKKIKGINKAIGVIMITAVTEPAIIQQCKELGAFDYLTKPVSLHSLEECLLAKVIESYK